MHEIDESSIRTDTKDTIKHCFKEYGFSEVPLLAEEPYKEFENLLNSLDINVMSDEYPSFGDDIDTSEMPISVQKKGWEDILRKQCIEKLNAGPDKIDISSDDSDLKENDNIEAIEEENPQIPFGAGLHMLDQLQELASAFVNTEIEWHLVTTTETLQDVKLQRREQASIKKFFFTKFSV